MKIGAKVRVAGSAGLMWLAGGAAAGAGTGARIGDFGVDLEARDTAVRPQDDFFRYANGTWLADFRIPPDLPGYSSFTAVFLRSEKDVGEILRTAAADAAPGTEARKIGDLYADFLDTDAIEAAGLEPIRKDLERIRGAGSLEDVARLLGEYHTIGAPTPFDFYVDQDEKDPDRYLPHFVQSGIGLPDRDFFLDKDNPRFAKARDALRDHLARQLETVGKSDPADAAQRVFALEERLAEAHWPVADTRDVDRTYNPMTQEELEEQAPGFPWGAYLAALGLGEQRDLLIMEPSAYTAMAKVFAETPVADWQAYLEAGLLASHAAFLPKAVDEEQFLFVSAAITGAKEQRSRDKRAVQFVNGAMGEAVGKLYVGKHFPPEAKRQALELVENLLAAMGQQIDTLDWMGPETKERARAKLAEFTVKIGYPDKWRDYSALEVTRGDLVGNARRAMEFEHRRQIAKLTRPVDRTEWLMNPQTVNAYYNPQMNEIVFPAAILQPPFFDPAADAAVNYGGIGTVIGHEIGHGFDDQGRKSDGDGRLRDWWTPEDAKRFKERADRLVEQYDAFSPLKGMHVNGRLTLGENIGDLGGVETAYHAYHLALHGEEPPVLDGLTGDQRFFLGFAQIWRGKMRDALMATLVSSNEHSPEEFRVNGPLRNVDAWYRAFDVKPGDAMYLPPGERVHIW